MSAPRRSSSLDLRTELLNRYERGCKLSGVVYVHRISDKRFTGMAGRNFRMFRELCGDSTLKNVVLVTNMWGEVSEKDGQDRENKLTSKFFKPVLDKGAQMIRHHNTVESAHNVIRAIIRNHPIVLQIQREVVDEGKSIVNTAAGDVVNKEINDLIRRHQAEMEKVREEMLQAMKEKDDVTKRELEDERRRMQEQVERMKKDSAEMASRFTAERERTENKMTQMMRDMEALQDLAGAVASIPICW